MTQRKSNSDLTDVDRAILRALHHSPGASGRQLAFSLEIPGRSIGSRLSALVRRGLIMSAQREAGMHRWDLTLAGRREALR